MSLVNDMLNDLEQRRSEPTRPQQELSWLTGRADTPKRRYTLLYGLLLVVVLVLAGFLYRQYTPSVVTPSPTLVPQAIEASEEAAVIAAAVDVPLLPARVELVSLSLLSTIEGSALTLDFTEATGYEISRQSAAGQETLTLRLSDLETLPASLPPVVAPVRSLALQHDGDDLLLVIQLDANTRHRAAYQHRQLLINFNRPAPKNIAVTPVLVSKPEPQTTPAITQKEATKPAAQKLAQQPAAKAIKQSRPPTLAQRDRRVSREARADIAAAQSARAEQRLQQLRKDYPQAPRSSALLVELLLSQQRLAEADQLLAVFRSSSQRSLELHRLQGRWYLLSAQPEQAVDWLLQRQPAIVQQPSYYELLGLASQRARRYQLSEQVYKGLLNTDAGVGSWWSGLAIAQELQGQKADARLSYQRALQANRISKPLRAYAERRYGALAGAVNEARVESGSAKQEAKSS